MSRGLFVGSFDPPSLGHVDIVARAAPLCSHLTVAVAVNPDKKHAIPLDTRKALLERAVGHVDGVTVDSFSGLVMDYAMQNNISVIFRGLRTAADFDYENPMAVIHKNTADLETVFFAADPAYAHISSSLVRQCAAFGTPVGGFLPETIEQDVWKLILKSKA